MFCSTLNIIATTIILICLGATQPNYNTNIPNYNVIYNIYSQYYKEIIIVYVQYIFIMLIIIIYFCKTQDNKYDKYIKYFLVIEYLILIGFSFYTISITVSFVGKSSYYFIVNNTEINCNGFGDNYINGPNNETYSVFVSNIPIPDVCAFCIYLYNILVAPPVVITCLSFIGIMMDIYILVDFEKVENANRPANQEEPVIPRVQEPRSKPTPILPIPYKHKLHLEEKCPVCFEQILYNDPNTQLYAFNCGHIICAACIAKIKKCIFCENINIV